MNANISPTDEDVDGGPTNSPDPLETNGLPHHRIATETACTALLVTKDQRSFISEDQKGDLATIFDTAQPRGSSAQRILDHERRMNEDGSFHPRKPPKLKPDGNYARPPGRGPHGMDWDSKRGLYVHKKGGVMTKPRKQKHHSSSKRTSVLDSIDFVDITRSTAGNPYARPRLPSFGSSSRAASRNGQRSSYTSDVPSPTGSFATPPSEIDPHNGKTKRTRSKGSETGSLKGGGEIDGKSGVSFSQDRFGANQIKVGTPRFINECCTLLARVDEEAHQRALVQDATAILEGYLFPMSFPWNHHSIAPIIKNYPKDIDELPAIAHADDDEFTPFDNGEFGYGGFEVGKERHVVVPSEGDEGINTFHAATRRSDDVGVIELTVIDLKSTIDEPSRLRKKKRTMLDTVVDSLTNGSSSSTALLQEPHLPLLSNSYSSGDQANAAPISNLVNNAQNDKVEAQEPIFQCFQQTQSAKKQKLSFAKESMQRLMVSVRFSSVSSRSSVLHQLHTGEDHTKAPLLREAVLPSRRPRSSSTARDTNSESDASEVDTKRLKKDNLLWTNVKSGGYSSTLTGSSMLVTSCKKPREVQVGVRLNGILLSYRTGETWSPQSTRDNIVAVDDRFVSATIDRVCCGLSRPGKLNSSMCILDCDQLTTEVTASQPQSIENTRTLPRLDCVPLALISGAIRVVCTSPGKMKGTCVLQLFRRKKESICSVCWEEDPSVRQCSKCGVLAHTTCCAHGGMMVPMDKANALSINGSGGHSWNCAACCESPKETASRCRRTTHLPSRYQSNMLLEMNLQQASSREQSFKCSLCPHSGGAMSPIGNMRWAHEVCLIWTRNKVEPELAMPKTMGICALCGLEDGGALIKCAGSDCTVQFHPMCALITVMDDDEKNGDVPEETNSIRWDERLCRRFTLDVLQCGETLLATGFCGFHNPKRDETLYGCYPGGMGTAMRIPAYGIVKP